MHRLYALNIIYFLKCLIYITNDENCTTHTYTLQVFAKEKKDRLLGISHFKLSDIELKRQLRLSLNLVNNTVSTSISAPL